MRCPTHARAHSSLNGSRTLAHLHSHRLQVQVLEEWERAHPGSLMQLLRFFIAITKQDCTCSS